MARRALDPVRLLLPLGLAALAGCNGQILEFQRRNPEGGTPDAGISFAGPSGSVVRTRGVDKVDLLFDIDNSASTGDKQHYLKAAIPDLLNRLINPNCVDTNGVSQGASVTGDCTAHPNTRAELPAVHDMHLGIVSSSLGARGGNVCNPQVMAPPPFGNVAARNDDRAHLLNRSLTFSPTVNPSSASEGVVADASGSAPFLYWYPAAPNVGKTPGAGQQITSGTSLIDDFAEMVGGAGVFGCGIESQLESWYRFLIQPDPYDSILSNGGYATWSGVDTELLRERHDFLRPDSLVAIVVLSDENDSEIDVRSIAGQAVNWMSTDFTPPKGTSACASTPSSSRCQSCAMLNNSSTDTNCMAAGGAVAQYTTANDWGYDINLRHVHMKAKYGIDVQFPIQRYVNGLTSTTVPDRNGEYPPTGGDGLYKGTNDCQNPLFAAVLPDGSDIGVSALCHAPPGSQRTSDLILYAHIGGVPNQLLHFSPGNPAASTLSAADWVKILGKDPEGLDYTGIDPHMIESVGPRPGLAPPGSASDADPISGHEWITDQGMGHLLQVDLQYACIFDLVDPTGQPAPRDCTLMQNQNFCDCPHTAGSVSAAQLPPVCDPTTITRQTAGKAYPTIRELLLAKKLGTQGIVSSICPIHVADSPTGDDPLYGYRPAVELLVDHIGRALVPPCLPKKLDVDPRGGDVLCVILVQMPAATGGTCLNPACDPVLGLSKPDPQVLSNFCAALEDRYNAANSNNNGSTTGLGPDPANVSVCELLQFTASGNPFDFQGGTCAGASDKGWCYVTGAAAGTCPQAVVFSPRSVPVGATANLVCP